MPNAIAHHHTLSCALRCAVQSLDFGSAAEAGFQGQTPGPHPGIDLAVVRFGHSGTRWANVLFSREHPQGLAAEMSGTAGALSNIRFDADQRDANGDSVAWLPGADWQRMPWTPLAGPGPHRFVAPYPASVLKLMVAVGVGLGVQRGLGAWPDALEPMIVRSDNEATNECVALLHRTGLIGTLNQRFAELDLPTLQLNNTTPAGGWRNADGAGVGQIHMTAWDTARLLWLLDADTPPPPWLPAGTTLLQAAARDHIYGVLQRQQHDHVLSSGSLRGQPGWVPGLPDAPAFAHKTGSTDNYASDAGIVRAQGLHYIVAVFTSLGKRHAPPGPCVTPWKLPELGAAVHRLMMEPPP